MLDYFKSLRLKRHRLFVAIIGSLPIFVLFYLIPNFGDDIMNKKQAMLYNTPLKDLHYIVSQYQSYSSRSIVNYFMYAFEVMPKVFFALACAASFCLLIFSLSRIFNQDHIDNLDWLILLAMYCLPFTSLFTAGWIATTVTYFIPVCLASYSLTSLFDSEKQKKYIEYFLMTLATLIAANNEQVMVFLLIIFALLFMFRRSTVNHLSVLQFTILIIDLFLFILSPGNRARNILDIKRYFPDFNSLSIINKVDMGVMSTSQHFVFGFIISYLVLLTLCIIYWSHQNNSIILRKYVTIISFIATILLGICFWVSLHFHRFGRLMNFPRLGLMRSTSPLFFIICLIVINLSFYLVVFIIASIHDDFKENVFIYSILTAGIVSRMAVCLSATQYASASRTFFVMEFSLLLVAIIIGKQCIIKGVDVRILFTPMICFAGINILVWIIALSMHLKLILEFLRLWAEPVINY